MPSKARENDASHMALFTGEEKECMHVTVNEMICSLISAYPLEESCDHFSPSSQVSQLCGCISSRDLNPEG